MYINSPYILLCTVSTLIDHECVSEVTTSEVRWLKFLLTLYNPADNCQQLQGTCCRFIIKHDEREEEIRDPDLPATWEMYKQYSSRSRFVCGTNIVFLLHVIKTSRGPPLNQCFSFQCGLWFPVKSAFSSLILMNILVWLLHYNI